MAWRRRSSYNGSKVSSGKAACVAVNVARSCARRQRRAAWRQWRNIETHGYQPKSMDEQTLLSRRKRAACAPSNISISGDIAQRKWRMAVTQVHSSARPAHNDRRRMVTSASCLAAASAAASPCAGKSLRRMRMAHRARKAFLKRPAVPPSLEYPLPRTHRISLFVTGASLRFHRIAARHDLMRAAAGAKNGCAHGSAPRWQRGGVWRSGNVYRRRANRAMR